MFLAACLLASLVSVLVAGGRLTALADLQFRHRWLLAVALALQVLIISLVPSGGGWWHEAVHMATYLMGGAFVVLNRHVPFLWLVGAGGLMNFAAIAANGGVMPARAEALATAGLTPEPGFANSATLPEPRLAFLGDVFAIPDTWPLANVFSVGDICIALGVLVLLHRVSESRLAPRASGELAGLRRNRAFARLWLAQAVSQLGDWIYTVTAVTLVARNAGTTEALAVLLALQLGPAAVVGALGGPLVDRRSRRGLMIAADLTRAAAVGTLLLAHGPSTTHLWVVAACLGGFGALFGPSLQASLPNLLPPTQLVAANAALSTTFTFAVSVGPVIGGFVVAQLGPAPAFAFNGGSFLVSAGLLLMAGLPRTPAAGSAGSPLRDLAEGLRYVAGTPLTRALMTVTALVVLAAAFKTPLEPLFVLDTLAARPEALGLLGAAWGLGMVIGAAITPAAARRTSRQSLLWMAIALVGSAILATSQLSALGWILALWLLGGTANAIGSIAQETLLQETTPDKVRGRVFAAADAVTDGSVLLGAVAGGALGALLGVRGALGACGAVLLLAAVVSRSLLAPSSRSAAQPMASTGEPQGVTHSGRLTPEPHHT
jgi:MFS family permease